jgi:ribosomal protein S18 acetylase RimI-like enzyme
VEHTPQSFGDEPGADLGFQPTLAAPNGPRLLAVPIGERLREAQAALEGAPDYFLRTDGALPRATAAAELAAEAEADPLRHVFALVPRSGPAVGLLDLYLHHPEPGVVHVGLLLFREACQGLGYGRETIGSLEHAAARAGFTALRCSVGDESPDATAFWERLGFEPAGRLDDGVTVYEKRV